MAREELTIRDIARLAGVSHSTVSLVLNNNQRISPETRKRVQSVMDRVGYVPNIMARRLVRRSAELVGVVMPHISAHTFNDSYFAEAISGISEALADSPTSPLIEFCTERFLEKKAHLNLFRERQIDGMLVVGTLSTDLFVKEVFEARFPIMLVNSTLDKIPCVIADNRTGVRNAIVRLHQLGHRRIAHIGGLTLTDTGTQRFASYRDSLIEFDLDPEQYLVWGDFSEDSGYLGMSKLCAQPILPTAVLAGNDMMAIGALRCLQERGLRVPQDISIVGADDIQMAKYIQPRLTTIQQPTHRIGEIATRELLKIIAGSPGAQQTVVPTEFIERDSIGPV